MQRHTLNAGRMGKPCVLITRIVGRASGKAPKYTDSAKRPMKFVLLLVVGIQELLFKFLFSSDIGCVLGVSGAFFST